MTAEQSVRWLVVLGVALVVPPRSTSACSCIQKIAPEAFTHAAAVFKGKATTVRFLEPDKKKREPRILVTFEVLETWKGPDRKFFMLRTTYNKWTCQGYYFKAGQTYVVTAFKASAPTASGDVELADVNICGTTKPIDRAEELLRVLGPGRREGTVAP